MANVLYYKQARKRTGHGIKLSLAIVLPVLAVLSWFLVALPFLLWGWHGITVYALLFLVGQFVDWRCFTRKPKVR